MALANFSQDGKHETLTETPCSAELTGGIHSQLICLSVVNSFLGVTAFLGNTLILIALHKESSLHPPSKLLFRTLAITDLCVGIITEPLNVAYYVAAVNERWNICSYTYIATFSSAYILCSVSLFTLTAISVDRLLALSLGLRYRQVVTLKRTYVAVIVFWVLSIVSTAMYFLNTLVNLWYRYIGLSFCLITSVFSYGRVFFALRRNQTQVQDQVHNVQLSQTVPINTARYKKTVYSALWVQLTLVACYVPYGFVVALNPPNGMNSSIFLAREFTGTLVFLNSSLNPILYCWKVPEVKQTVKDSVRQLCCSFN